MASSQSFPTKQSLHWTSLIIDTPQGVGFECNGESKASMEFLSLLRGLVVWVTKDQEIYPRVFATTLGPIGDASGMIDHDERWFVQNLTKLRGMGHGSDFSALIYKYLFAACLVSSRPKSTLRKIMEPFPQQFGLGLFERGVIGDALLSSAKGLAYQLEDMTMSCKVSAIALLCLLLRLDGATHIRETEALRVSTAIFRCGTIAPATLMAAMGKEPTGLMISLPENARFWALLQLLRVATADGSVRPREKEFIEVVLAVAKIDEKAFAVIDRTIYLESGIAFRG